MGFHLRGGMSDLQWKPLSQDSWALDKGIVKGDWGPLDLL